MKNYLEDKFIVWKVLCVVFVFIFVFYILLNDFRWKNCNGRWTRWMQKSDISDLWQLMKTFCCVVFCFAFGMSVFCIRHFGIPIAFSRWIHVHVWLKSCSSVFSVIFMTSMKEILRMLNSSSMCPLLSRKQLILLLRMSFV